MRAIKEFLKNDRFAEHCGIELVEVGEGRAKTRMKIEDRHLNGVNVVHGGAIFSLADLAFAAASNSHGTVAVAINASIWYVKAGLSGTLFANAREVSLNPKLATYSIEVTDDAGEIIAVFEGMVYRKKQTISPEIV
ncbi:MAG: PaaI family thioesterase [Sedimentisphaerales bacterium]|jgi:acyl-CoA thioesterase|nr:PaaI family thioesterase [Sedimentisphaerales bacterium]HNY79536.1 PaaI family thioesterase [Sedimentisphaerales bacterium]HOC62332.1 PaaI family thioesterase [Sedimentisphaerales bacterium]HOH65518.1 PaaI family thioesterase [Sedimentisphaerales bacterium]HPY50705.1 PaaI family thioesterase [Sedimentisphaerales bacterium]